MVGLGTVGMKTATMASPGSGGSPAAGRGTMAPAGLLTSKTMTWTPFRGNSSRATPRKALARFGDRNASPTCLAAR